MTQKTTQDKIMICAAELVQHGTRKKFYADELNDRIRTTILAASRGDIDRHNIETLLQNIEDVEKELSKIKETAEDLNRLNQTISYSQMEF